MTTPPRRAVSSCPGVGPRFVLLLVLLAWASLAWVWAGAGQRVVTDVEAGDPLQPILTDHRYRQGGDDRVATLGTA